MATDLEIARSVTGRNITEVAKDLGLSADQLVPYGYDKAKICLLYTSPSPRDRTRSRMPSSA